MANKFSNKAIQLNKATKQTMIITGVASFVIVFGIFASMSLWGEHKYLSRVTAASKKAQTQLNTNIASVSTLTTSYNSFVNSNKNVIGGFSNGTGQSDGNNATIVLDSLPSQYDFPALVSSIQNLLSNYTLKIVSISGTDDPTQDGSTTTTTTTTTATTPTTSATVGGAVEMPFSFTVSNLNYDTVQQVLTALQESIRPIQVDTLHISGGSDNLTMDVTAHTYYQPGVVIKPQTEVVK